MHSAAPGGGPASLLAVAVALRRLLIAPGWRPSSAASVPHGIPATERHARGGRRAPSGGRLLATTSPHSRNRDVHGDRISRAPPAWSRVAGCSVSLERCTTLLSPWRTMVVDVERQCTDPRGDSITTPELPVSNAVDGSMDITVAMFRDELMKFCKRKFLFFYTRVCTVFSLSNDISL
jgi:hypothetical protein